LGSGTLHFRANASKVIIKLSSDIKIFILFIIKETYKNNLSYDNEILTVAGLVRGRLKAIERR
jgi:hypothetical protein